MAFKSAILAASLALLGQSGAQSVDGSKFDNPTAGPPASYFAAATTMPVAALQSAAAKASQAAQDSTYPISSDNSAKKVTIHSDWSSFSDGAAFVWVADMDVDCDGLDYKCQGNPDGLSETNFGALAAYEVPWIVIPDTFGTKYQDVLPGNNIGAVICNGKMFYGIYGDSDGDSPEVIGEASWLMARTCFPNDNLNGNSGHGDIDVTYILFTGKEAVLPTSALNKNYVTNFSTLRSMGDNLMNELVKNLKLSSGGSATVTPSSSTTGRFHTTSSAPTSSGEKSCAWPGHCTGASCSTENDCSGDLVCKHGKCASP